MTTESLNPAGTAPTGREPAASPGPPAGTGGLGDSVMLGPSRTTSRLRRSVAGADPPPAADRQQAGRRGRGGAPAPPPGPPPPPPPPAGTRRRHAAGDLRGPHPDLRQPHVHGRLRPARVGEQPHLADRPRQERHPAQLTQLVRRLVRRQADDLRLLPPQGQPPGPRRRRVV